MARLPRAPQPSTGDKETAEAKRMRILDKAWKLESCSSQAFLDGVYYLSTAVNYAAIGRIMAAGAEAKVS